METYPADLDSQLDEFASSHGLTLVTHYRDEEVRSLQIVDDQSASYQLWLEPTQTGWKVKAWDYGSRRSEHQATTKGLRAALREAYGDILVWIREAGHTRTPV